MTGFRETSVTVPGDGNAARRRLAGHLVGSGIEIGPGQHPFRLLPPGVNVRLVDRWQLDERRQLAQELGGGTSGKLEAAARYVEPDIIADFNTDRLAPIPDASQDFVIASHVLEHLSEPIGLIAELHRVLRPGGVALILLPDRQRTEDRFRSPTSLEHLVAEYRAGVTDVSDAHLTEFLKDRGKRLKGSPEQRRRTLDGLRKQSIHVHCWNAQEFAPVLLWGIEYLGEQWEFVDGCLYEPPIHYEFGFVLRRSESEMEPSARSRQFEESWRTWRGAEIRRRPEAAGHTPRHLLPAWAYRQARRLVRQYRLPAWAYREASQVVRRSRGRLRTARRHMRGHTEKP